MAKRTALYEEHVKANGKLVEFGGWDMPLHYGSQIAEHEAVRGRAGMFDVSHMTIVDFDGEGAEGTLEYLIANDVAKLDAPGQALYGALLNDAAGVVDDLIVYRTASGFRMVVNAATRDKVVPWLESHNRGATITERVEHSMIAVQGPQALAMFEEVTGVAGLAALDNFSALDHGEWLIGRTGYTGEDGVEVMLPAAEAVALWQSLAGAGIAPAGLAARDTLRLEAGLNLYGQDMTEDTDPYESNLGWTVALKRERDFIGRAAVERIREVRRADGQSDLMKLTGVVLTGKGIMRHDYAVHTDAGEGVVTSGIFSPTLGYSIALARVPKSAKGDCEIEIRRKRVAARLVKPPFVRNGEALV